MQLPLEAQGGKGSSEHVSLFIYHTLPTMFTLTHSRPPSLPPLPPPPQHVPSSPPLLLSLSLYLIISQSHTAAHASRYTRSVSTATASLSEIVENSKVVASIHELEASGRSPVGEV